MDGPFGDAAEFPRSVGGEKPAAPPDELYREIFEDSPTAIWIEDWSRAKAMIDQFARRGVVHWDRYFVRRHDQLIKAYDLCGVTDVMT